MKLLEPMTLVGRHVRLVPLCSEHASPLLVAADESRNTYAFTLVPSDLAGMQAYGATALEEQRLGQSLPFAVRDRRGTIVRSTRFIPHGRHSLARRGDWPQPLGELRRVHPSEVPCERPLP